MTSGGGIAGCVPRVFPLIHRWSSGESETHPHVSAQWDQAVRFFGLSADVNTPAQPRPTARREWASARQNARGLVALTFQTG